MTAATDTIDLEHSIEKLMQTGRFASKEDVVREGVRLLEAEEAHWAALDAAIERGLKEADAGHLTPAEEVFDRLSAKYKAMIPAK
jgi:antitoxin ParD1/3/4